MSEKGVAVAATGERPAGEGRIFTIPNVLSLARLAAVPVFVWLFVTGREDAAVVLYAIAAWTDFFDGYIARRTDSVTELGRLLDPLADRIFIAALAIALVATEALDPWLAVVIVGRDLLILGAYPFVQRRLAGPDASTELRHPKGAGRVPGLATKIRVNFTGKSATAALLLGLTLLAVGETSFSWASTVDEVGRAFVWLGAVLYWVSGAMYARSVWTMTKEAA